MRSQMVARFAVVAVVVGIDLVLGDLGPLQPAHVVGLVAQLIFEGPRDLWEEVGIDWARHCE